uniref:Uncharacterized protein n=1 Tax=Musa acuminata subsp. malaccensis TaxID=214687 RepID=A0A804KZU9_MUSAM
MIPFIWYRRLRKGLADGLICQRRSMQWLQWNLKDQLHWVDQESPTLLSTLLAGCMDFSLIIKT